MTTKTATTTRAAKQKELGAINGVNHLVIICKDMDATMAFYGGLLGLKLRTSLDSRGGSPADGGRFTRPPGRFNWLDLGNGDVVALLEDAEHDTTPEPSFAARLWPVQREAPAVPKKMDHLALNVDTLEDLKALRVKLLNAGGPVSVIDYRPNLVHSIYFYDPNGTPLEAATWARPGDGAPSVIVERTLT